MRTEGVNQREEGRRRRRGEGATGSWRSSSMRAALGVAGFASGGGAMERGANGRSSLSVGAAGFSWWLRSKELGLGRWLDACGCG